MLSWRRCREDIIRYRVDLPRAACKSRYWTDRIKLDGSSTHYAQNRAIKAYRRKGDKRFEQQFNLLSRGPLSVLDLNRATQLEAEGRECFRLCHEAEVSRNEQVERDRLTASEQATFIVTTAANET